MNKRMRQYLGIFAAIFLYYLIHEGAHLLTALYYGVFKQINFLGLGIQIDIHADLLTDTQLGIFCLTGPLATLLSGWLLALSAKRIRKAGAPVFKAVMWYTTLAMLILDPLYVSILCGFFGGGDLNGIRLLFPEAAVRIFFAVLGIFHAVIIRKHLLPLYKKAVQDG